MSTEVTAAVQAAADKLYEAQTSLEHARKYAPEGSDIALVLNAWIDRIKTIEEEVTRPIAPTLLEPRKT